MHDADYDAVGAAPEDTDRNEQALNHGSMLFEGYRICIVVVDSPFLFKGCASFPIAVVPEDSCNNDCGQVGAKSERVPNKSEPSNWPDKACAAHQEEAASEDGVHDDVDSVDN